jgi:hypothetical protein
MGGGLSDQNHPIARADGRRKRLASLVFSRYTVPNEKFAAACARHEELLSREKSLDAAGTSGTAARTKMIPSDVAVDTAFHEPL